MHSGIIAMMSAAAGQQPVKREWSAGVNMPQTRKPVVVENRNPVQVLNEMRRDIVYEFTDTSVHGQPPSFAVKVDLDGVTYTASGQSKKAAKAAVAEKVLFALNPMGYKPTAQAAAIDFTSDEPISDAAPLGAIAAPAFSASNGAQADARSAVVSPLSPVMILDNIRPHLTYEESLVGAAAPPQNALYRVSVLVDEQTFSGEAGNKKLAKARAAESAISNLFGLQCTLCNGAPVFIGESSQYLCFRANATAKKTKRRKKTERPAELEVPTNPEEMNAVNLLIELFCHTDDADAIPVASMFAFEANAGDIGVAPLTYSCTVTVQGRVFQASGKSKKVARLQAASLAVEALRNSGELALWLEKRQERLKRRDTVKLEKRTAFIEKVKAARAERIKSGTLSMPMNAVQKLHQETQVEFHTVNESVENCFTVAAVVDGHTYTGTGRNKRLAKVAAAEVALRALGKWTDEDENVKADIMKREQERMEAAKIKMQENMATASGASKRRKKQPRNPGSAEWVAGGVLGTDGAAASLSSAGYGAGPGRFGGDTDDPMSGFGAQNSGFGQQASGFGQHGSGFGQQTSGFGQQSSSFGPPTSGFGQQASGFGQQSYGGYESGYQDTYYTSSGQQY